ncbi:protein prenylyltransferase [Conidiobolus coronatus NRRL 28638]|uniref:Geranylgeranyl transferase type-2 subunit alpha n=1 Tax=Conidiobolus coronatus (strain ATCC 28846 / CBS 209.66 / NRRL 28638) TaxID=796925 RepID=A0A137PCN7_CONC2|nr:protein prenylyltransferase [Conidiobolus coronatus NRRL 28638]|eukprot:KXN72711.1 protein prenylyltransferase [Conidiobolus coronatus NRRL 28638]
MASEGLHGKKREKLPQEVIDAKLAQDKIKIKNYTELCQEVYQLKNDQIYNERGLELTKEIIILNSDFNTIWNFRRQVLLELFKNFDETTINNYLEEELRLVEKVILIYPKSYWLWNHRRWVLETSTSPNWSMELMLVSKMLSLDNRNFHGWNYRRHILDQLYKTSEDQSKNLQLLNDEIKYTKTKIEQSFSNGSAWFYRTKLIEKKILWNQKVDFDLEYDLVKNATYTDPEDQSAWIYYRWLINRDRFWLDSPKFYTLSTPNSFDIILIIQDNHLDYSKPSLKSSNQQIQSLEWLSVESEDEDKKVFKASLNPDHVKNWEGELELTVDINNIVKLGLESQDKFVRSWAFKINEGIVNETQPNNIYHPIPSTSSLITSNSPELLPVIEIAKSGKERISKELEELQELINEEPDSKWALQTQAYLIEKLNNYIALLQLSSKESTELLDTKPIYNHLKKIDQYRKNRYIELLNNESV